MCTLQEIGCHHAWYEHTWNLVRTLSQRKKRKCMMIHTVVPAPTSAAGEISGALNFSAAATWACWLRSSICTNRNKVVVNKSYIITWHFDSREWNITLASPNTIYVSDTGFLNTSGLLITNRMFLDFLIVTLLTPWICHEKTRHEQ